MPRALEDVGRALAEVAEHLSAHRFGEARRICDELAKTHPEDPEVLHVSGLVRFRQGESESAIELLGRSLELRPDSADVLTNLGAMQEELGNNEAAYGCFAAAHDLAPEDGAILHWLSRTLFRLGNFRGAEAAAHELLKLAPNSAAGHFDLGHALRAQGRLDEALAAFRRTTELDGDNAGGWYELGDACATAGLPHEATKALLRASSLSGDPSVHRNLICTQPLDSEAKSAEMVQQRRLWAERYAEPLTAAAPPPENDRSADRIIRVGYVLADTCRYHTHSMILLPLIEAHDRGQVEVHCYSDLPQHQADNITDRFVRASTYHETGNLDDAALAARIRQDRIDIAVDAVGHPAGSRLLALARKPAPVQLCFPYQATNWMTAIEYVIGDPVLLPGWMRQDFKEQVVDVSVGHVYRPLTAVPEPASRSPFETSGYVTFGNFGRLSRINDSVLRAWARILAATPSARLLLKLGADGGSDFERRLAQHGISPERVKLAPWTKSPADHLAAHREIDLLLDTFPYGGVTTSCEALVMGVPILTLTSDRVFGRYAAKFLNVLGMNELITSTVDDYVAAAIALGKQPQRLAALREGLANRFLSSPICDGTRMARELERVYRNAWHDWCRKR